MKQLLGIVLSGAAAVLFTMARPSAAPAMPMFARKYGVSCSTCHTTPPRLNQTGYKFRAAGFRMPEEIPIAGPFRRFVRGPRARLHGWQAHRHA